VGGQTVKLTVQKNGADQTPLLTFSNVDTDLSDVADSFAFAAGDRLSIKCVASGGGAVLANVSASLNCTVG
jgi:hypothetical protein